MAKGKAKKQRAKKSEAASDDKRISQSAFNSLIRDLKSAEADKDESVGSIRSLISVAVEKHGVNKKALAWFRAAERMSGSKLRDILDQFDHMREIGGLNKRAAEQVEAFSAEERGTTNGATNGAVKPKFADKLKRAGQRKGPMTPAEIKAAADRAEERSEDQGLH